MSKGYIIKSNCNSNFVQTISRLFIHVANIGFHLSQALFECLNSSFFCKYKKVAEQENCENWMK